MNVQSLGVDQPGLTSSRSGHNIKLDTSMVRDDEQLTTNRKRLTFIPFTADTYHKLLVSEAIEKLKEATRKEKCQEAHLKDGELQFGSAEPTDKIPDHNPDLEEGKVLKPEYGTPPDHYMGLPLEEVDKGITDKTFVVISRWLHHLNISRFSATYALFLLSATSPVRRLAVYVATNQIFDFLILFTIFTNCICLAIPEANNVIWLEYVFFGIYCTEMIIKIVARGLFMSKYTYLRDPWNWLDMIVITSGLPSFIMRVDSVGISSGATQALRTFRVLRALKTISIFPGLRTIVNAMLRAMKMLMEVVLLTMFCLLVFSLVSVQIYSGTLRQKCVKDPHLLIDQRYSWESYDSFYQRMLKDPNNWLMENDDYVLCGNITGSGLCKENYTCLGNIGENPNYGFMNFDNVFYSGLIMFQLMTIDFWENAYRKVLQTNGYMAVIYFFLTVFFGSFYLLNLMLAVVTITYQEEAERTNKEIESEKASRRQRKEVMNAFYKMSSLAAKQQMWIKLLQQNRRQKLSTVVSRETPLEKLIRLRTAVHVWKKKANFQNISIDPKLSVNFQQYATRDREALDVLLNVAYHFKKWHCKTLRTYSSDSRKATKKLTFNILSDKDPHSSINTGGSSMTSSSQKHPKLSSSSESLRMFRSQLQSIHANMPQQSNDPTSSSGETSGRVGSTEQSQRQKAVWQSWKREDNNFSENQASGPAQETSDSSAREEDRVQEQSHLIFSLTVRRRCLDDTNAHHNQSRNQNNNDDSANANPSQPQTGDDTAASPNIQLRDPKRPSEDSHYFDVPDTLVIHQPQRFKLMSQVGKQLLISAVNRIDYSQYDNRKMSQSMDTELAAWNEEEKERERRQKAFSPTTSTTESIKSNASQMVACVRVRKAWSSVRQTLNTIVSDICFDVFIYFCIILNTIMFSLQYHGMTQLMVNVISIISTIVTLIFDVEAVVKMTALGLKPYFASKWNRFDVFIALLSSISVGLELTIDASNRWLQFLRTFRLVRVLKLAQVWPAMNLLLTIVGNALSALGQLTIILGIILYIFAIIGLQVFQDKYETYQFPEGVPRWNFKDFFHSFMLMFRVLCGEWIEPLWDCMRIREVANEFCMMVFLPTLIFGNFVVLNLFLALLLNAFGENPSNAVHTPETTRLKELKRRFKHMVHRFLSIFTSSRKVRLIIHRPHYSNNPLLEKDWQTRSTTSISTCDKSMKESTTTESKSQPVPTVKISGDNKGAEFYMSVKGRRGGTLTADIIQMRQVVVPIKQNDAPPCFPMWILNSMYLTRERFNKSKCGKKWMAFRYKVMMKVQSDMFEYAVLFIVIASSVLLAIEDHDFTHTRNEFMDLFLIHSNQVFALLFGLEMVLRWIAFGLTEYFTSAWTIIDFIVVVVSAMGVILDEQAISKEINAFRALRAFRPLRVVSRIQGMKIVVNSLLRAIPAILNVFMVSMLFWLIFCVMGVNFFSGKFYKCIELQTKNIIRNIKSRKECEEHSEYVWYNSNINFDNVPNGFLALFQVATFEGWMEVMFDAVDATEVDSQPQAEESMVTYAYFVAFIICGSFFSLNLVIGVIIDNFNELKKKYEGSYLDGFLTPSQRTYYNTLKKMSSRKPQRIISPPVSRLQMVCYDLSISDRFELLMMGVLFLNTFILGVQFSRYKLPCHWYEVLWITDLGFCLFFDLEVIMKIIGLRQFYFTQPWNCYDFIVALLSSIDLATHMGHQNAGIGYLNQFSKDLIMFSPVFLRLLRIFRISRVLRIVKVAKGLRKVVFSLMISLPAIINIMALLMLCLYIYAIFGMFLFSTVKLSGPLNQMMNFRTFKNSAILLLSLATAAGWNDILGSLMIQPPFCNNTHHKDSASGESIRSSNGDCGFTLLAVIYLVSYVILTFLFIINMYIAVILENYNQAHQQDEVGVTEDDFDMFYSVWQRYDPRATQYLPYTQLSDFVADLETPLGIPKPNEIALVSINLPILEGDKIHCLDILLALVRNVLRDLEESDELFTVKQQISSKFRERFPDRSKMKTISSTIERKKEDVAARTLQRAWQVFKTQQAIHSIMKMTVKDVPRHGEAISNPSPAEELSYNMTMAHAHYFRHLRKMDKTAGGLPQKRLSSLAKEAAQKVSETYSLDYV